MKSLKECRVIYQNQTKIWNLDQLLKLDQQWVLEFKNGLIRIRDFGMKGGIKGELITVPYSPGQRSVSVKLPTNRFITLMPSIYPDAIDAVRASSISITRSYSTQTVAPEDRILQQSMKRILGSTLSLCLLVMISQLVETEPEIKEEVIPKKYAKLILKKQSPSQSERASGMAGSSTAAKTVSKAFQSKTVQKSLQKILQNSLSRYTSLSTGRSIQILSQSSQAKALQSNSGLGLKSESLLANSGVQIGSSDHTNVSGQGTGKIDIGLNYNDAIVEEGLTKEEVAKVIHSHMNEIRYCYESAILSDPSLAGKVLVDFKISSKGGVATANAIENSMKSVQVGGCLIGKLKNWKFPEPRGGVQVAVSYPFIFKSMNR